MRIKITFLAAVFIINRTESATDKSTSAASAHVGRVLGGGVS
jgi:hypothetical protein